VTSQDSAAALAERYGAPPAWRRPVVWAASGVVVAAFLGWLAWTIVDQSTMPVESELVSFDPVDEHTSTAIIDVRMADDASGVSCLLRAFAEDHSVVGELSFVPEPGDGRSEQRVRTERQATSVELVGCTADGQARPR
jgi:hypothetical protein